MHPASCISHLASRIMPFDLRGTLDTGAEVAKVCAGEGLAGGESDLLLG